MLKVTLNPIDDLQTWTHALLALLEHAGGDLTQAAAWAAGPEGRDHPACARALLALGGHLGDSGDALARLRPHLAAAPLPLPPRLSAPLPTGRRVPGEMRVRLLGASLCHPHAGVTPPPPGIAPPLERLAWPRPMPGGVLSMTHPGSSLQVLREAAAQGGGPLACFVAHPAELPELLEATEALWPGAVGLGPERSIVLGSHLDLTEALSAETPQTLSRLRALVGRTLLVLGAERLPLGTLEPLLGLLEDLAEQGQACVRLISPLDWPLPGVPHWNPAPPIVHSCAVKFEPCGLDDLLEQVKLLQGRTAVVLPSRKAALAVAAALPGAVLLSRSLCSAHRADLIRDLAQAPQALAVLTLGMLGETLGHWDTVWHTLAPLEHLALACRLTPELRIFEAPEVGVPHPLMTALDLTRTALTRGEDPQDRETQHRYAEALMRLSERDHRAALAERKLLNFSALRAALAPRDPAIPVFVPFDGEAETLIAWIQAHAGAYPERALRYATRMSRRAFQGALERGEGTRVGAVGVWTAAYHPRFGIGQA